MEFPKAGPVELPAKVRIDPANLSIDVMKNIISRNLGRENYSLTSREKEVLALAVQGLNRPQIAVQLGLQPLTIGTHMKKIFRKLGVHSRSAAVAMVLKQGVLRGELKDAMLGAKDNDLRGRPATSGRDFCPSCGLTCAS